MYYANASPDMFVLSGRLRIRVKGLRGNSRLARQLADSLSAADGVVKATANPHTGNALILFDETATDVPGIIRLVDSIRLGRVSPCVPAGEPNAQTGVRGPASGLRTLVLGAAGLSAYGALNVLLPSAGGNAAFPAIALGLAVPLGLRGARYLKKTGRVHHALVFFAVTLLSVCTRQGIFALPAVLAGYAAWLIEALLAGRAGRGRQPPAHAYRLETVDRVYRRAALLGMIASVIFFAVTRNIQTSMALALLAFPLVLRPAGFSVIGRMQAEGASHGIEIHNPASLTACKKVDAIVFGDAELLAQNGLKAGAVVQSGRISKMRVLALAASCLAGTDGPAAEALAREAQRKKLELFPVRQRSVSPEAGIVCLLEDGEVCLGSCSQLSRFALSERLQAESQKFRQLGFYPLCVAFRDRVIGFVALAYQAGADTVAAVEGLREAGVTDIRLLSPADDGIAGYIAERLGIGHWDADGAPDRTAVFDALKKEGVNAALVFPSSAPAPEGTRVEVFMGGTGEASPGPDFTVSGIEKLPELLDAGKYAEERLAQVGILSTGLDATGLILLLTRTLTPYQALFYKLVCGTAVLFDAGRRPHCFNEKTGREKRALSAPAF